jgi:putative ABC transport system permease protein
MGSARARKIAGDLLASRSRTVLVTLSIAIGVTAVGMVAGARSLMLRTLDATRDEAAFPSATLRAESLPSRLLPAVRGVPGVADAETRRVVGARVVEGGSSRDLRLVGVPGFERLRIGRVTRGAGAWPPPPGTMLVERSSLGALGIRLGGSVRIQLPSGARRTVRVTGTVHDVNLPSTRVSGVLYGYVTYETLQRLGDHGDPNELLLRVPGDRRAAERAAASVRRLLARNGVVVTEALVPKPGAFWAAYAVEAMVLLLTVLAVVCLFLGAFLVVNVISALVKQQTRQIGVMKAIGARPRATAALYLGTAEIYGIAALVLAVPLAAVSALALVDYSAGLINLDIAPFSFPPHVLVLQVAAGVALPLAAALVPAVGASRLTVREAIADTGRGAVGGGATLLAERAQSISVALRLALTNTLRRRGRLILTIATLALAGAVFVGVLSVRTSLHRTIRDAAPYREYDVDLALERAYPRLALERVARTVQGVARAQAWSVEGAYRVRADGSESQTFSVVGAPAGSDLLQPRLVRGRQLRPGDGRAVIVNTDVLDSEPGLGPGDEIRLAVNGRPAARWRVVGVAQRIVVGPVIYADGETLARAAGEPALARRLVVVTRDRSDDEETAVATTLTSRLERAGFAVRSARTSAALGDLDRKNLGIIVSFLLAMAALLAIVGGLGLAGMLSISVLERSREIGVLRAVGARDRDVLRLVMVEGLVIAAVGWVVAAPLGYLVGRGLSDAVGHLFLGAPLAYSYSGVGLFVWLGLTLVLAVVASVLPARRAMRLTVRDVLAYE